MRYSVNCGVTWEKRCLATTQYLFVHHCVHMRFVFNFAAYTHVKVVKGGVYTWQFFQYGCLETSAIKINFYPSIFPKKRNKIKKNVSLRKVLLHLSIPPPATIHASCHPSIADYLSIYLSMTKLGIYSTIYLSCLSIYYSIFSTYSISSVYTVYLFFLLFYLCGGFGRFPVQWWGLNSTQTQALAGFGMGLGSFGFGQSQAQWGNLLGRFWAQWWSLNFNPDPGFGWGWIDLAKQAVIYPQFIYSMYFFEFVFFACFLFYLVVSFHSIFFRVRCAADFWQFIARVLILICASCQVLQRCHSKNNVSTIYIGSIIQSDKVIIWDCTIWKKRFCLWKTRCFAQCLFFFWFPNLAGNGFSMTGIMESHWHLIKNIKCEQFVKFWKVVEHCGLLAQVSKAGLTNVCNRGFYSTNLSPKSGKRSKKQIKSNSARYTLQNLNETSTNLFTWSGPGFCCKVG